MCGFKRPCEAVQQSDQMYCDRCALVWDMNDDDPPECKTHEKHIEMPSDEDLLRRKEEDNNRRDPCKCQRECIAKILEILENKQ